MEILKQGQFEPLPFSKQILIIFAGTSGLLDDMAVEHVRAFEKALYAYVDTTNPGCFKHDQRKEDPRRQSKADMAKTIKEAKERFLRTRQA